MTTLAEIRHAVENIHGHNAMEHRRLLLPIAEAAADLTIPACYQRGGSYLCTQCGQILYTSGEHEPDCAWVALQTALAALEKGK